MSSIPWWLVLLGIEVPPVLALIDAATRPEHQFPGGAPDKVAWRRWMVVAVLTAPLLVGFLLVVAYYNSIIRRSSGGPWGSGT